MRKFNRNALHNWYYKLQLSENQIADNNKEDKTKEDNNKVRDE